MITPSDLPTRQLTIDRKVIDNFIYYQCPQCTKRRKINVKKFKNNRKTISIRCYCHSIIKVNLILPEPLIDFSQQTGVLINLTRGSQQTRITILKSLQSKIEIRIQGRHLTRKGDRVKIHYRDTATRKEVFVRAIVTHNYGKLISCMLT